MNKRLFCLATAFLAPLGASSCAQAQPCGIKALFGGRGAESLAFYECTDKGGSARAICRPVSRKKSVTFRRDGTASGNYFDRKEGFTGTWKQRPDSGDASVTEGPALGITFSVVDGKYLVYFAEEGNDIHPYVLEEKIPSRIAAGQAQAQAPDASLQAWADAFAAGLVHIRVTGTDVRLRTGPGTSHPVLRKVNASEGAAPGGELAASRETASGDAGKGAAALAGRRQDRHDLRWLCRRCRAQARPCRPAFGSGHGRRHRDVTVTRRDGRSFCATNREDAHYVDGRGRLARLDGWNVDELCGTIAGGRLTLKDGTALTPFPGEVARAFPRELLQQSAGK